MPAMDDAVATAAYRITQEALTNVARHAEASRAEVRLHMEEDTLVLQIWDDGRGFNSEDLSQVQMLGLAGMRERAALVGGTLRVQSAPKRGTTVVLRVSLELTLGNAA